MRKELLLLSNLNCPSCAGELEKAARKLHGVQAATVGFATGTLQLEYDEAKVADAQIVKLVRNFGAGIVSRTTTNI